MVSFTYIHTQKQTIGLGATLSGIHTGERKGERKGPRNNHLSRVAGVTSEIKSRWQRTQLVRWLLRVYNHTVSVGLRNRKIYPQTLRCFKTN